MAIGVAIVRQGNQGRGPVPYGSLGEETVALTGDGSATSVVVTSGRMRRALQWLGTGTSVTFSGKTATITFAAAPANGAVSYGRLIGLGR